MTDYQEWVRRQAYVCATTGQGTRVGEGVVVAYTDAPTVTIRLSDGTKMHWRAALCTEIGRPCDETEGLTGISCGLRTDHLGPHEGAHRDSAHSMSVRWLELPAAGGDTP